MWHFPCFTDFSVLFLSRDICDLTSLSLKNQKIFLEGQLSAIPSKRFSPTTCMGTYLWMLESERTLVVTKCHPFQPCHQPKTPWIFFFYSTHANLNIFHHQRHMYVVPLYFKPISWKRKYTFVGNICYNHLLLEIFGIISGTLILSLRFQGEGLDRIWNYWPKLSLSFTEKTASQRGDIFQLHIFQFQKQAVGEPKGDPKFHSTSPELCLYPLLFFWARIVLLSWSAYFFLVWVANSNCFRDQAATRQ